MEVGAILSLACGAASNKQERLPLRRGGFGQYLNRAARFPTTATGRQLDDNER